MVFKPPEINGVQTAPNTGAVLASRVSPMRTGAGSPAAAARGSPEQHRKSRSRMSLRQNEGGLRAAFEVNRSAEIASAFC